MVTTKNIANADPRFSVVKDIGDIHKYNTKNAYFSIYKANLLTYLNKFRAENKNGDNFVDWVLSLRAPVRPGSEIKPDI